jgi:hypothetical protein
LGAHNKKIFPKCAQGFTPNESTGLTFSRSRK